MAAARDLPKKMDQRGLDTLLAGYSPLPGVFDELMDADGQIRPHWESLIGVLGELGAHGVRHRFDTADRQLRDSGVFYRVYADPNGGERPWPLAHVPLVIDQDEWRELVAGVVQRADLVEAVLADAYGPGHLVSDGALPAAAIGGNPDYLRPLVGVHPKGDRFLRIYAVDVGRGPDGGWWVLGDRTQAPSGMGYALENRIALARALTDVYRSMNVERLADFFRTLRDSLAALNRSDETRVGLLTPGPLNETYFEHSLLARYLGFQLVEGEDLTLQGDDLMLRTVSGLRRMNVLLRRLDSDFTDPLELNISSRLGVPGLLQAVRAGSVTIANAIGSGLAEGRVLQAFWPQLGRHILGETPLLPNIATWWCGQPREREIVLANLDTMVIAPAFGARVPGVLDNGPVIGAELSAEKKAKLVEAIRRRGVDFVGQEVVRLSTMPVWSNGRLEPRPFILRLFLTFTENGWVVMPGGFCRVSERVDARAVTMQSGGRSADAWVTSTEPVHETTLLPTPDMIQIRRATGALPSRAADNLFWMARYVERAEATVRVVRALAARQAESDPETGPAISRLRALMTSVGAMPPPTARGKPQSLLAILSRPDLFGSPLSVINNAKMAGSVIRDRLSPDAWRALTDLSALLASPAPTIATAADALDRSNQALRLLSAFAGLAQENMNRLTGWRFQELGRRIERAVWMCRYVRAFGEREAPASALDVLLELADSQLTYRSRYAMIAARAPVVDLVLLDGNNPRSAAFQLDRLDSILVTLPGSGTGGRLTMAERISARLDTELRTAEPGDITPEAILSIENRLYQLSNEISLRYFTPKDRPTAEILG